eukprot:14286.XXX_925162_925263_1 [CDS] Oithona nana genome sequencing.
MTTSSSISVLVKSMTGTAAPAVCTSSWTEKRRE